VPTCISISICPPYSTDDVARIIRERIQHYNHHHQITNKIASITTFVLAVPTWNPKRGNDVGLSKLQEMFQNLTTTTPATTTTTTSTTNHDRIRYLSLGYERNIYWQKVPSPYHIVPIPYVVTMAPLHWTTTTTTSVATYQNSTTVEFIREPPTPPTTPSSLHARPTTIFYSGDTRPNAVKWSGCHRTAMLQPLMDHYSVPSYRSNTNIDTGNHHNVDVRLINSNRQGRASQSANATIAKLSMSEYNDKMRHSQYCLIVCGDTPTSRSLSSAIIHGCIPLFIGQERWYGRCGNVCHPGWGWNVLPDDSNISHLPYDGIFDYAQFPSIDEHAFLQNPVHSLEQFLNTTWSTAASSFSIPEFRSAYILWIWSSGNDKILGPGGAVHLAKYRGPSIGVE
jgi:Exostosin family